MSRHVVAYEGKPAIDGFYIHQGALRVEKEPVPVTMAFSPFEIIGRARDLQRNEETGEVSMEVEFIPRDYAGVTEGMNTSLMLKNVVGDRENVREGVIVEVTFLRGPNLWS